MVWVLVILGLTIIIPQIPAQLADRLEPPPGQRCSGRNYQGRRCCTPENPCGEGEGDCDGPGDGGQHDGHAGCQGDLKCGSNNCKEFGAYYHEKDDCCEKPEPPTKKPVTFLIPLAHRCAGRHVDQGRRCCTAAEPCVEGEGDCDGDDECQAGLVCGDNNCKQFGAFFHHKDDCCIKTEETRSEETIFEWGPWQPWTVSATGEKTRTRPQVRVVKGARGTTGVADSVGMLDPNIPLEPPSGQRCSGRNYQGRRCCTPENPCGEGEGDCDGPGDGGQHDGHAGCQGDLKCGSNNCKKFGAYYHEKDDCCEKPEPATKKPVTFFIPLAHRCAGRHVDQG